MARAPSALEEYSTILDEKEKERRDVSNTSLQITRPKTEFINNMIREYLLSRGLTDTYELLSREDGSELLPARDRKLKADQTAQERELLLGFLRSGQEKDFFRLRDKLYDDMNYFKIDFDYDHVLELKQRAYFTVHPLIPRFRVVSFEEAWRQAKARSEQYKKYVTEAGVRFMHDEDYRHYMRLPYLLQHMSKDDQLLKELLADEFAYHVEAETARYTDQVAFQINRVSYNRSLLSRAFDYNVRFNEAYDRSQVQAIYEQMTQLQQQQQATAQDIREKSADLDATIQQLAASYKAATEALADRFMQLHAKTADPSETLLEPISFVQQKNPDLVYSNWKHASLLDSLRKIRLETAQLADSHGDLSILRKRLLVCEFMRIKYNI